MEFYCLHVCVCIMAVVRNKIFSVIVTTLGKDIRIATSLSMNQSFLHTCHNMHSYSYWLCTQGLVSTLASIIVSNTAYNLTRKILSFNSCSFTFYSIALFNNHQNTIIL